MDAETPESRPRRFLTVGQVAEMLSMEHGDIEALLISGELPAIRLGADDSWRIEEGVLDGYLEAKYEESRRSALWNGFDFGSVTDLDPARRPAHPDE